VKAGRISLVKGLIARYPQRQIVAVYKYEIP